MLQKKLLSQPTLTEKMGLELKLRKLVPPDTFPVTNSDIHCVRSTKLARTEKQPMSSQGQQRVTVTRSVHQPPLASVSFAHCAPFRWKRWPSDENMWVGARQLPEESANPGEETCSQGEAQRSSVTLTPKLTKDSPTFPSLRELWLTERLTWSPPMAKWLTLLLFTPRPI